MISKADYGKAVIDSPEDGSSKKTPKKEKGKEASMCDRGVPLSLINELEAENQEDAYPVLDKYTKAWEGDGAQSHPCPSSLPLRTIPHHHHFTLSLTAIVL